MTFKKLRSQKFTENKMVVSVYEHLETGAIHYHTEYDTQENSFSIAFRTLPENSKGTPHILEHSVLCGSNKYPLKNVFFSLKGRNLETFLNASTGFDTTQYPFSSIDKQGFFNILSVYLDVVFFPTLDKKIFLQEGWRHSIKLNSENKEELAYAGVVFNEMVGALSDMNKVIYVNLLNTVFANSQYENFSGGNPLDITDLSYEEFIAFHKKFYHPSNATLYTFGSIPVSELHQKFEELALSKFSKIKIDKTINVNHENFNQKTFYSEHPAENGLVLLKGWKLAKPKTIEEQYERELLINLLQNGKTDVRDFYLNSNSNIQCDGFSLLSTAIPCILLSIDMKTDVKVKADELLSTYFEKIIQDGISEQEFDNIFDSLELKQRLGSATSSNLGLSVINKYISLSTQDLPNIETINDYSILKKIRENLKDKKYLKTLLLKTFINNKESFDFISIANPNFNNELNLKLKDKLNHTFNNLTSEDIEQIKKTDNEIIQNINKTESIEVLPKLKLKEISLPNENLTTLNQETIENIQVISSISKLNNVSQIKLYFPLEILNNNELCDIQLVSLLVNNLNLKNLSLEETNFWKQTKISSLQLQLKIFNTEKNIVKPFIEVSATSLEENTSIMIHKIYEFIKNLDFSNTKIIEQLIQNTQTNFINNQKQNAFHFAVNESQSKIFHENKINKILNVDFHTKYLNNFNITNPDNILKLSKSLENTYNNIFSNTPIIYFFGNEKQYQTILSNIQSLNTLKNITPFIFNDNILESNNVALDMNVPSNYIAYAIKAPNLAHKDSASLNLLSSQLEGYLVKNIRQIGSSYGANVNYSPKGAFVFYSYSDPNHINTIKIFNDFPKHIEQSSIEEKDLDSHKMNLIKEFKKSLEPIQIAGKKLNQFMNEFSLDETSYISNILNTSVNDLKNITLKYFKNHTPYVTISTNEKTINDNFSDWEIKNYITK